MAESLPSKSADMLSQYSTHRDQYGIPIILNKRKLICSHAQEQWNQTNEELRLLTNCVRELMQRIEFTESWSILTLWPVNIPSNTALTPEPIDGVLGRPVSEEMTTLTAMLESAQHKWREISNVVKVIMTYKIRDIAHPFSTSSSSVFGHSSLIRLWNQDSHSPWSEDLGFRCSDWVSCKRFSSFQDFQDSRIFTLESVRNHCKNASLPSSWLSMAHNVSWVLRYARSHDLLEDPTCRVAVIGIERLEKCNVYWRRSDILVTLLGGRPYSQNLPDGVEYAWPGHFLAYGWIPAQCVITIFTIAHFLQLCKERNIKEGKYCTLEALKRHNQFADMAADDIFIKPPHMLL